MIIYIKLLNEGTNVWRPVNATKLDDEKYRIDLSNSYSLKDETWQFEPGSVVKCKSQKLSGTECLVAIASID